MGENDEIDSVIENPDDKYGDKYKMFLKTVQGTAIKSLTEALKDILLETNINFDSNGIKIINVDPSQVTIILLKLDANEFEEYYCPKPIELGVGMIGLHRLLKTIGNNDTVSLFVAKNNPEKLGIHIQNKKKAIDNLILFNLMNVDFLTMDLPNDDPDVVVEMPCGEFQKYCRELSNVSHFVKISVKKSEDSKPIFVMEVDGNYAKQTVNISESENVTIQISNDEFSEEMGVFSLKFLNLFCKSGTIGDTIKLYVGNNYPIFIVYPIASLGTCTYCLFPTNQISNKEDE